MTTLVATLCLVLGVGCLLGALGVLFEQARHQRALNRRLFEDYQEALRAWRNELHALAMERTFPVGGVTGPPSLIDVPEPPQQLLDFEFRHRGSPPPPADELQNHLGI